MLVLSRQREERIIIGDEVIVITILDIRGDKVRIGIDAPKGLSVHREEVYKAIKNMDRPPVAEAACDVRGLAGADYETRLTRRTLDTLDARHPPEDDQPLLDKMEDEQRGNC
jgi:carbon storage regulator